MSTSQTFAACSLRPSGSRPACLVGQDCILRAGFQPALAGLFTSDSGGLPTRPRLQTHPTVLAGFQVPRKVCGISQNWLPHRSVFRKLLPGALLAASLFAQAPPERPRITGAAHIAYCVTDLKQARAYYEDFLGFQEAFSLKSPDGSDDIVFIKINDHQFIELWREAPKNYGYLHDVAFQTENARGLRAWLAAHAVKVSDAVANDVAGDLSFEFTDPFGFTIQLVEYVPDSWTGRTKSKFMPETRPSTHIDHLGILIGNREVAAKFYGDNLGFAVEGDGSKQRIGDGPDRFELGFERKPPGPDRFHIKNHICLSAPDVPKLAAMLKAKPAAKNFKEIETHQLDNGKHVAELYDLDGNRVEIMEPPGSSTK